MSAKESVGQWQYGRGNAMPEIPSILHLLRCRALPVDSLSESGSANEYS